MLRLPTGKSESEEGQDDAHPIVLEGIKADDFREFLDIL